MLFPQTISVFNPFSGEEIAKVPVFSDEQVLEAVAAAESAFSTWKNTQPSERSALLIAWCKLVLENAEELAVTMVSEQGKPYKEALGEVKYAASYLEFYAEEAKRIYGDVLPSPFPNSKIFVVKQPVGVVGIITPWNFPAAMMMRKIAPALAAGCTCVVKPDENTPLTAFALGRLAQQAGIPAGVINMITGVPSRIGELLCSSETVKKISFTGSTEVGKLLMRQSADTLKRITLELGGNAPFIVFADADIDSAVQGLMDSKFRNAGQTCVCPNRVFIQKEIKDIFIEKLMLAVTKLSVGSGLEGNDIGPLINQKAVEKVERLIADCLKKGGLVKCGGTRHELGGNFFAPTILDNVTTEMDMAQTEIFGPIVAITSFSTVEEVIKIANDTKFGLAGYFYTQSIEKVWAVAEALEVGMVGVNTGIISSAHIPFGGIKESGFGREGSKYGIEDYLSLKYINLKV